MIGFWRFREIYNNQWFKYSLNTLDTNLHSIHCDSVLMYKEAEYKYRHTQGRHRQNSQSKDIDQMYEGRSQIWRRRRLREQVGFFPILRYLPNPTMGAREYKSTLRGAYLITAYRMAATGRCLAVYQSE